jgi:hypothetical protein
MRPRLQTRFPALGIVLIANHHRVRADTRRDSGTTGERAPRRGHVLSAEALVELETAAAL